ncbi:SusD/RagB family nutrient-binding outer membrane lipoprotein [Sinomicrobium kalidii]|uniref:SusD/RagB family nutrient-binding outer membrane lipoprotein n=1 Tax=Sinomicrobium kalidii TaxID=2900738 RepID=UPI001E38844F|nr:SusD/RagB family nutrient-binding outer membrane lipoprotein [Sinomicrobium kalidii]UGU14462.1 SusD/RagB family nutrient-binding outer membrane lipoprotein [Sinomicrobium kalidii]
MKMWNHKIIYAIFSLGILFSCETTELDLAENPNQLPPGEASPDFYLNKVQEDFARLFDEESDEGLAIVASAVIRLSWMDTRQYLQAYSPSGFDIEWRTAYSSMLTDIYAMYPLAEEAELKKHVAMGKVFEAFTIVTLVDFFGEIPYSEALQGAENFNPAPDPGASVYQAALTLLDEAIILFQDEDYLADPEFDMYYNGNWENWEKLANSLKIKIYIQQRLVDDSAIDNINQIVSTGMYITDISEDFQFRWGRNIVNPDTRHPKYIDNYKSTGAESYMSNWLMNYMQSGKVGNAYSTFEKPDPRIRFYFYRQNPTTPGNGAPTNQQELTCSVEPAPQHYVDGGYTFCNLPNGYWGRDHGDDDGIPPDGNKRTTWGVYPAGGRFDDNTFEAVTISQGGGGAGITPIFLSSTVDFLLAEISYISGNTTEAKDHMLSGIAKSFTKVRSFGELDSSADLSLAGPESDDTAYMNEVGQLYDDATGNEKLNIIAKEFWVTLFGNGIDAYNFYRRTGAPLDLQPNLEPNPGGFIRSFLYPAAYANNNSNISQKPNVTTRVFWDNNPEEGFPIAN